jgi:large subunit ribosomal protein L25
MASNAKVTARPRAGRGKSAARRLRAEGGIPAVIYGHGEETRELTLNAHEFEHLLGTIHYENTIFELDIEGETGEVRALVRELQRHPLRGKVLHVDFHQIHRGEKVHVSVPVRLIGSAPGVRAGGMLQHTTSDLEVRVVADRIPETIDVDVTALEIGDSVHVRDLTIPEGVELLADADRTICSVAPPAVAAVVEGEEVEEVAPEGGEPEVIRRGREEEEEAED